MVRAEIEPLIYSEDVGDNIGRQISNTNQTCFTFSHKNPHFQYGKFPT